MQVGQLVISSNQNLVYAGLPSLTNKLATPTAIADNPFVYWKNVDDSTLTMIFQSPVPCVQSFC